MEGRSESMCVVMGFSLGAEGKAGEEEALKALTQQVDWLSLSCEEKGQREDMLREGKTDVTWVRLSVNFQGRKSA